MSFLTPRWAFVAVSAALFAVASARAQQGSRTLTIGDMRRFAEVSDPELSPDGDWIVYAIATVDTARDHSTGDIWLARWDGTRNRRVTWGAGDEHSARFVGNTRAISFLSSRGDPHDSDQLWVMPMDGGEAQKLTTVRDGVNDYSWSPDGKRVVLALDDSTIEADSAPHPIVLDRYQFKADVQGYLDQHRTHLWIFDVATKSLTQLTSGDHDDDDPQWDSRAVWSPDSKEIAFLQGGPDSLIYFATQHLAVVPAAGGPVRVVTRSLDRSFVHPAWSGDGKWIYAQLEDDGSMILARVARDGSSIQRALYGRRSVAAVTSAGAHVAIVQSTVTHPDELFAVYGVNADSARQLSDANPWLREIQLAEQEPITTRSKDGTVIHGFLMRPVGYESGRRVPTILRLHGGPVSEWENGFELSWQLFAAHGYAVVGMNPRGSSGRGREWAKAIFAHWGEKDVQDVLSGVDYAVAHGIADPQRLGVGGWSYGGELTDYVIASDMRFKAAIAGAGIGNVLAGFGTDQYVREYTQELGVP